MYEDAFVYEKNRFEDDGGLRTKSYLLQGEIDKPWLKKKDWRDRATWWITFTMIWIGIAASAAVCWNRWATVLLIKEPLCLVMQDDFDTFSVDHEGATWMREVDMSGFGNGEFEMTTNFDNNSFVKDGKLYIMPTLTSLAIGQDNVFNDFTFNITGCTNTKNFEGSACGAVSNQTSKTVINPVMSARLTTQKSHSIRYGRIDIRAKLPRGDWLWPALWMLPVDNKYGPWPLSGEIDIMESRGNDIRYTGQGSNVVRGSLNWGPTVALNAAWRTFGFWFDRRKSFANDFHIYTMEWSPEFIRMSVDNRLHKMLELRFNEPFFTRGDFPAVIENGTDSITLPNPWASGSDSTPFDQPFYLIMNVAVGGTSGWFPDNLGNKPWLDNSGTAMYDFAHSQDTWYATWPESPEDRAMVIDYVKMYELC
ncbi:glycoside hydrolase family 16 protein [Sphaerobolus stellatus SS14]|uniref:Glycoside hydrolase family 16 protein n=1 Tax=Sphaerobolus stellatus (strain SS14) TaxID=990650 RepID=A0A0C9V976_SPHS4|nr:glycoside hydrolase family 16 protein [Sphaerobolus stellatus SS14]